MKAISVWFLVACWTVYGQTTASNPGFTVDAQIYKAPDGNLVLTAKSQRPLLQALDRVRLRYGWNVDYAESRHLEDVVSISTASGAGLNILRGGTFTARFREPSNSSAKEERRVLTEIVAQYNQVASTGYRVKQSEPDRFDIVPEISLLDLKIQLDSEPRSLRAQLDAIGEALTGVAGTKVVQGGLISNAMEQTSISLKHSEAVPARQLLNEVLQHSPMKKVWLFTYEPTGDYFAFGVQTTEQWTTGADGKVMVRTFENTDQ